MYLLYNFLLLLAALVLLPYYILRGIKYGKSRRGVRERLGYYAPELLAAMQEEQIIWVHAVSVGETRAAIPLLKRLRRDYPEHRVLLSNVTETGHAIALESPDVDFCIFFPFDFSWVVRRALQLIQPQLVIIVETEIWPNFCRQAKALGIPLVLVNGRISDRSFPRYRKLRFLLKPVLESFSAFCMQTQVDAERISTLGAENIRVENTGNLKFDHELIALDESEIVARKNLYRLPDDAAILVAGSTHDGEEKLLCDAYRTIAPRVDRSLVMVLIPRHPERKQEVAKLLKDAGLECRLRTALSPEDELSRPGSVLVIDTLGEVLDLYSVADLVFVGGSLVPVGGHNLLEASLLAKPVLFGPHVHNFREIATKLVRAGAGIRVEDNAEFVEQSVTLLRDSARSRAMGEAGRALIVENSGATERTMKHVSRYLNF